MSEQSIAQFRSRARSWLEASVTRHSPLVHTPLQTVPHVPQLPSSFTAHAPLQHGEPAAHTAPLACHVPVASHVSGC